MMECLGIDLIPIASEPVTKSARRRIGKAGWKN